MAETNQPAVSGVATSSGSPQPTLVPDNPQTEATVKETSLEPQPIPAQNQLDPPENSTVPAPPSKSPTPQRGPSPAAAAVTSSPNQPPLLSLPPPPPPPPLPPPSSLSTPPNPLPKPSNGVKEETLEGRQSTPNSPVSEDDKAEDEEEEEEGEKEVGAKRPLPSQGAGPRKIPIMRLKKKGDDINVIFERQDASKNDSYCWVCHDGGDVLCCDRCPRVFHVQCSGLPKEPEGEEEWFCPVCKNIDRRTKRSRPPNLRDLLLLAVKRMMFPGTEIFQKPVPSDIMKHYQEYIFFPMYLNKIKERVEKENYATTRQFLHDTEWILHNCIIYNGAKHALTKIAKGIVKVCKEDMREIELCPSCYKLTVLQPEDWFCIPCSTPHRVVLAKVRGYPLWPAKLISETTDKCDVRFFGQHDRSLVPKSCIQELTGPPPTPSSKTQYWNIAMYELRKYRENIDTLYYKEVEKPATPSQTPPNQPGVKPGVRSKPSSDQKSQKSGSEEEDASTNQRVQVLSHLPFSPKLFIPSMSENDDPHGNSSVAAATSPGDSPPSSPGSERDLQIDDLLWKRKEKSPVKPPRSTETKGFISVGRRTQNSLQSMLDTELGPVVPALTPGGAATPVLGGATARGGLSAGTPKVKKRGLAGVVSDLSKKLALSEDADPDYEEGNHPLFSRCYDYQGKTAIAEIDPEQKRPVRKVKRPGDKEAEPSPKKAARGLGLKSASLGTPEPSKSPSPRPPPASLAPPPPPLSSSSSSSSSSSLGTSAPLATTAVAALAPSLSSSSSSSSSISSSSLRIEIPRKEKPKSSSGAKKQRGRPPKQPKPAKPPKSHTATAIQQPSITYPAPPTLTATPTSLSTTPTSQLITPPTLNNISTTLSQDSNEVRRMLSGTAPAVSAAGGGGGGVVDGGEVLEGTGLLAETIRKVDRSFRAKLVAGSSDDLGYQYFVEKLMSSIKTVLIEMLSQFEAKGKMGAKVIREQLHSAWPVPGSRTSHEQLRRDLLEQLKQELEVVRAAADMEREQVVSEVRRQAEAEKEIAIAETKKKKWCSYCMKEAMYNCCWNANYCNESCQQAHWPEHMKSCVQARQSAATPTHDPPSTPQARPSNSATTAANSTPTDHQTFVYAPPPPPAHNPPPRPGSSGTPAGHIVMPHPTQTPVAMVAAQPSPRDAGGASSSEPVMHYAESTGDTRVDHPSIDKSMSRIEHITNDAGSIIGTHQTASQQMTALFLQHAAAAHNQHSLQQQQQQQGASAATPVVQQPLLQTRASQQSNKNPVISSIRGHTPSGPIYQSLVLDGGAGGGGGQRDSTSASHAVAQGPGGASVIPPRPSSPASPASEHSTVHNPPGFSWPYHQQPVIISSTDGYPMPLLQSSSVAQQQQQPPQHPSFFKAF